MTSPTTTHGKSNFHEMLPDRPYCADVENALKTTFGVHISCSGASMGLIRVDDGGSILHVTCVDEIPPTKEEVMGERFGVPRDRVFYFRSPLVVACEIEAKRATRRDLMLDIRRNIEQNVQVQLPSYTLPIEVKGFF